MKVFVHVFIQNHVETFIVHVLIIERKINVVVNFILRKMIDKNFKVTMECYDKIISIERDHPDITLDDAIEDIATCLLGLTFSKKQIIQGFKEYAEVLND
jgi:hypothetical protein